MNVAMLLLLVAGMMLVMANELAAAKLKERVVYRYLPRDLDTYVREQPMATAQHEDMFTKPFVPRPSMS